MKRPKHLKNIRTYSCLLCGDDTTVEAAHIRFGITGMGRKPDDALTIPLCHKCHMEQHRHGEAKFWRERGINPKEVAFDLFRCTVDDDVVSGEEVVRGYRNRANIDIGARVQKEKDRDAKQPWRYIR